MKVLIIDDEVLVRRSLSRAMKSQGHTLYEAADGMSGVEMWKTHQPDLVFVDVLMPGLKGPEVIKKMAGDAAKIVLMTAFSGEEILSEEKLPVDLFIKKPFEDIFEVIRMAESLVAKT